MLSRLWCWLFGHNRWVVYQTLVNEYNYCKKLPFCKTCGSEWPEEDKKDKRVNS